jgi:two-component system, cell cycle sensor histidine kinase and response regulator CckA
MAPHPGTILLVENGEILRPLLVEILQREGHEVLAAKDASEALPIWDQHSGRINLIVTDVVMPGMSGKELVERLRSLRPEVKVIYISGYESNLLATDNKFGPEAVFLQKPFRPAELIHLVREALAP